MDLLIHSFIHSFIHSLTRSFIPSFSHSFIPSFSHSFSNSFIHHACSSIQFSSIQFNANQVKSIQFNFNTVLHPFSSMHSCQFTSCHLTNNSYRQTGSYSHVLFLKLPPRGVLGTTWYLWTLQLKHVLRYLRYLGNKIHSR